MTDTPTAEDVLQVALRAAVRSPRIMADPREQSRAAYHWWTFVHNALVHPCLAFPFQPRWAQRAHDWTAERCVGRG